MKFKILKDKEVDLSTLDDGCQWEDYYSNSAITHENVIKNIMNGVEAKKPKKHIAVSDEEFKIIKIFKIEKIAVFKSAYKKED